METTYLEGLHDRQTERRSGREEGNLRGEADFFGGGSREGCVLDYSVEMVVR
jgi:hypothetical protein